MFADVMLTCRQCRDARGRPLHGYYRLRDRLRRRAGGCNWLPVFAPDGRCPHCGKPLEKLWPDRLPVGAVEVDAGPVLDEAVIEVQGLVEEASRRVPRERGTIRFYNPSIGE